MSKEAALDEALFIASGIPDADSGFENLSFMSGALGRAVFLSAAEVFEENLEKRFEYKAYRDKAYACISEELSVLPLQETGNITMDISLACGLSGIIHSLLLIHKITGQLNTSLFNQAMNLIPYYSPAKEASPDFYLGLSGYIYALCELLDFYDDEALSDASIYETVLGKIEEAMDFLLSCKTLPFQTAWEVNPETVLLWDTIKCQKPISGLGHGMLGIAVALIKGSERLKKSAIPVSKEKMPEYIKAFHDALKFEYHTYNSDLHDWPDLRPKATDVTSLHGICSGAAGIGLGLLCLESDILADERNSILSLVHESCLMSLLRAEDHLCCGKSAICEYLLTRYNSKKDFSDYEAAGCLLDLMKNERTKRSAANYMLNPAIPKTDTSLFFGSSGIGYEFLRFYAPDRIPSVFF
ncbi:lanthionine synthetase LanC family protein [Butyrivibrio sp. VCD2006]|uniref:lanthionine synthetase LanC family protein n=1 Tax=Butyrivibrio sp. VCD2006 TaxID=1280664 RepID=UPI000428E1D1|nr:lanthionine synthetase LanC family protein [Butyrivibrio sp. VCD2006]